MSIELSWTYSQVGVCVCVGLQPKTLNNNGAGLDVMEASTLNSSVMWEMQHSFISGHLLVPPSLFSFFFSLEYMAVRLGLLADRHKS